MYSSVIATAKRSKQKSKKLNIYWTEVVKSIAMDMWLAMAKQRGLARTGTLLSVATPCSLKQSLSEFSQHMIQWQRGHLSRT